MTGFIAANGAALTDTTSGQVIPFAAGVPAALTANVDTAFAFSQPVAHIYVQNKSATDAYIEWDAAAGVGSVLIQASGGGLFFDIPCSAVHLYSTAGTNVNGAADLNIVVKGWL
jgi:hypothetical protein